MESTVSNEQSIDAYNRQCHVKQPNPMREPAAFIERHFKSAPNA